MRLIVCIDDGGGMAFHQRRRSRDRLLTEHILAYTAGGRLWMNAYSQKLFPPAPQIQVAEDFLKQADEEDYAFAETGELLPYQALVRQLILYKWNRRYPSDTPFPFSLTHWKLHQRTDFPGFSHPKITEEIYLP